MLDIDIEIIVFSPIISILIFSVVPSGDSITVKIGFSSLGIISSLPFDKTKEAISEDEAKDALEKNEGDIAAAIMALK